MASLRRSLAVSLLFTVFGGPGIVLVYLPYAITRFRIPPDEPVWELAASAVIIAAGVAPLLESIARFVFVGRGTLMPTVPTERLVVSGLYRYVRNPMYVGDLTALCGEAVLFRSYGLLIYTAVVWFLFDLFIKRYEEPKMQRTYGAEYEAYRARVRRWWPQLPAK